MNVQKLTDANIKEYLPLIPPELPSMELKALHFMGVSVLEQPAGVLIWKESKKKGEGDLLYLYVMPEFRGVGAGEALFSLLKAEMKESGTNTLFINYSTESLSGTSLLTSFFIKEGADLESVELRKGYVYLSEAEQSLYESGIEKSEGKALQLLKKLPDARKNLIRLWIEDHLSIDSIPYFSEDSLSLVSLENNVIKGLILVLKVKDQIRMDYLYTDKDSPVSLVTSLIANAAKEAKKLFYKDDPLIGALLQNPQTQKVWTTLFGEPSFHEVYISGEFSPGKLLLFE
ncbi:MAG: GNAT family N-acetyltransferase [Lachnospiraceae bacterium]|nr:GNAT family N-acetyltransferase [Lachnospiraceae bacterium]